MLNLLRILVKFSLQNYVEIIWARAIGINLILNLRISILPLNLTQWAIHEAVQKSNHRCRFEQIGTISILQSSVFIFLHVTTQKFI